MLRTVALDFAMAYPLRTLAVGSAAAICSAGGWHEMCGENRTRGQILMNDAMTAWERYRHRNMSVLV